MAELKTRPTRESVNKFISKIADETRRKDCKTVLKLMADATHAKPEMWGSGIVGFGRYRYKYASGREAEWMDRFSPRKNDLTLYITLGFDSDPELMDRLGKYKTGKACLYIKKLADVNLKVLQQLIQKTVDRMADRRIDK